MFLCSLTSPKRISVVAIFKRDVTLLEKYCILNSYKYIVSKCAIITLICVVGSIQFTIK